MWPLAPTFLLFGLKERLGRPCLARGGSQARSGDGAWPGSSPGGRVSRGSAPGLSTRLLGWTRTMPVGRRSQASPPPPSCRRKLHREAPEINWSRAPEGLGRSEGTPWPAQPGVPSVASPSFSQPAVRPRNDASLPRGSSPHYCKPGINLITHSSPRGWGSEAPARWDHALPEAAGGDLPLLLPPLGVQSFRGGGARNGPCPPSPQGAPRSHSSPLQGTCCG